jgi:DNA polymerase-4
MSNPVKYPAGEGRWKTGDRAIAHIDMDAFYASVELLDFPELSGLPVVVGGDSNRGVVSAASYEARKFGIHSAMPIFRAKRLCSNLVIRPGRMTRYVELSREVMDVLHRFSPLVQQISIDEAYVDLTGTEKLFGLPSVAVITVKAEILASTSLSCSIGLSSSKLIAKVASDMNKPDGITIVPPSQVMEFLRVLPVGRIPGIGEKSEEQLIQLGVREIGDLSRYDPEYLEERFGKFGRRLSAIAEGRIHSELIPWAQPKSVSNELTMPEDTGDMRTLEKYLMGLADKVGRRLRRQGLKGRTVTLKVKTHKHRLITRSSTLEKPVSRGKTIYEEARRLLEEYGVPVDLRLIGVGMSGLEPESGSGQFTMFEGSSPEEEKWDRVEKAVDSILDRFGRGSVRKGRQLE